MRSRGKHVQSLHLGQIRGEHFGQAAIEPVERGILRKIGEVKDRQRLVAFRCRRSGRAVAPSHHPSASTITSKAARAGIRSLRRRGSTEDRGEGMTAPDGSTGSASRCGCAGATGEGPSQCPLGGIAAVATDSSPSTRGAALPPQLARLATVGWTGQAWTRWAPPPALRAAERPESVSRFKRLRSVRRSEAL